MPGIRLSPGRSAPLILGAAFCVVAAGWAQSATPVATDIAREQDIVRQISLTGSVTSPRTASLSPSVGGLVQRIEVDIGDRVAAGDLLLQLDPELESLALERSLAAESVARSALADARRRLEEAERLRADNSIAATEAESRRAQSEMAAASLESAAADVSLRRASVRRHAVRAPFDGVISERLAELGEWVAPGDEVLKLVAMDALYFDFRAPQEIYELIDQGTRIRIGLDVRTAPQSEGSIVAIIPVNDPRARTFLLRAKLRGAALSGAVPGMSARAILAIDLGRRAVVVPRDALLRYPDGRVTVWIVMRDNGETVVRETLVETGLEFDGIVEVRGGLAAGAEIVTRGNEALQNGQAVTVR